MDQFEPAVLQNCGMKKLKPTALPSLFGTRSLNPGRKGQMIGKTVNKKTMYHSLLCYTPLWFFNHFHAGTERNNGHGTGKENEGTFLKKAGISKHIFTK